MGCGPEPPDPAAAETVAGGRANGNPGIQDVP
jgi:hypothetical protein